MEDDTVATRMAADRASLRAHAHGGLDDLHTELDKSAVHEAARENDLGTLRGLLAADDSATHTRDKYGLTPLHWAAERGHGEAARLLLAAGADANSVETRLFRRTPLHYAAVAPSLTVVDELLAHGADINAVEYRGWTALHYAAYAGADDVVAALLRSGICDTRRTTCDGETPHALASAAGHESVAQTLEEPTTKTTEMRMRYGATGSSATRPTESIYSSSAPAS